MALRDPLDEGRVAGEKDDLDLVRQFGDHVERALDVDGMEVRQRVVQLRRGVGVLEGECPVFDMALEIREIPERGVRRFVPFPDEVRVTRVQKSDGNLSGVD